MKTTLYSFFHPDLTNDKILKALFTFAFPIIISTLFQQLYNTADTVIVGHFLGDQSLAAIGACTAIYELLIGFGTGFGSGLGIVAARYYGAQDIKNLKKVVASSLLITLGVTIFIMTLGHFGLMPLLNFLGTPESIIEESFSYIWTVAIWSGVLFAYNLLSALLRAIGNSFMPLVFLIISSILNVILDIVFIKYCSLGVRGTAIATVLAQGISALLCLLYICLKTKILIPHKKSFSFSKNIYKDLLEQGFSMALMSAIVSSGSVILQSSINSFGENVIEGHISARKIFSLSMIPITAFGVASSTFVSQNLGAKKYDRIKKGVLCADITLLIYGLLCTLIIPFIAPKLIFFISGSSNKEVLDYGTKYISFMQPFYGVLGVLVVTRNSLQGLGTKILPLISSLIELAGKILFTLLIVPHLGIWGIIICEPLIWVVMTVQLLWSYCRHIKGLSNKIQSY